MPAQQKKKKSDPDVYLINPTIVEIAKKNGFVRQSFNLYLAGKLTWEQALEMMLIALYEDYRDNKILLNKYIQRKTGQPTPKEMLSLPVPKKVPSTYPYERTSSCPMKNSNVEDAEVLS